MSTIGTAVTMLDFVRRQDPDGSIAAPQSIAEMLMQVNQPLADIPWMESNKTTSHLVTIRTGLPTVYFRQLNQGVLASKSTTVQVEEDTCMMEARGQVDEKLAMLNSNTAAWRISENAPFVESMGQTAMGKIFYGNTGTDPEQITGIATRYSDNSGPANSENIIDAGGTGSDNCSIWLIRWSEQGVFGIYPKGSPIGLQHQDLGVQDAFDTTSANTTRFRALMDLYRWDLGIVVKNWQYAVRAANIDVSNLIAQSSAADLLELMAQMVDKLPIGSNGTTKFYCTRTVKTALRIQCMNRPNVYLNVGNEEGKAKLRFDEYPIELCDQLLSTESAVS